MAVSVTERNLASSSPMREMRGSLDGSPRSVDGARNRSRRERIADANASLDER